MKKLNKNRKKKKRKSILEKIKLDEMLKLFENLIIVYSAQEKTLEYDPLNKINQFIIQDVQKNVFEKIKNEESFREIKEILKLIFEGNEQKIEKEINKIIN